MASSTVISGGAIALNRRLVCVARWWSVANERYPQPREGAGSGQGCGRSLTVAPSTLRMTAAKKRGEQQLRYSQSGRTRAHVCGYGSPVLRITALAAN